MLSYYLLHPHPDAMQLDLANPSLIHREKRDKNKRGNRELKPNKTTAKKRGSVIIYSLFPVE
jgi:hypothetical protein